MGDMSPYRIKFRSGSPGGVYDLDPVVCSVFQIQQVSKRSGNVTRRRGSRLRAALPRIQVKRGDTYEAVTARLVSLSRTSQAGLDLLIRAEASTDEVWEGHYLKALQTWRVVSDKWGRVTQLEPQGPLEYLPDPSRAVKPFDPDDSGQVLEGEIIFAEKEVFQR